MDAGGLWNSFLMVGRAQAFLDLYAQHQPVILAPLEATRALPCGARSASLEALYQVLPAVDISRDVLQGSVERLGVLEVPPCGWTDLGTPERVAECLEDLADSPFAMHAGGNSVLALHQTLGALSAATHAAAR
jgi:mannose-1-phosphate guanylyltransferase